MRAIRRGYFIFLPGGDNNSRRKETLTLEFFPSRKFPQFKIITFFIFHVDIQDLSFLIKDDQN